MMPAAGDRANANEAVFVQRVLSGVDLEVCGRSATTGRVAGYDTIAAGPLVARR
jgi:hypothetical protein